MTPITEETVRCRSCGALQERTDPVCEACGRVQVPGHEEWGAAFKRWLVLRVLASKVAAVRRPTLQHLWERILADSEMLEPATKRATPAPDLYLAARARFDAWMDAGRTAPAPFERIGDV